MYTAKIFCATLDDILRLYNKADIYITRIHADSEFKSVFRELDETWEVNFNSSLPQEHVPDIEHENRFLKERFRAGVYCLLYKILPKSMIWYLALRVKRSRSYFPKKTRISKIFSTYNFETKASRFQQIIHSFLWGLRTSDQR